MDQEIPYLKASLILDGSTPAPYNLVLAANRHALCVIAARDQSFRVAVNAEERECNYHEAGGEMPEWTFHQTVEIIESRGHIYRSWFQQLGWSFEIAFRVDRSIPWRNGAVLHLTWDHGQTGSSLYSDSFRVHNLQISRNLERIKRSIDIHKKAMEEHGKEMDDLKQSFITATINEMATKIEFDDVIRLNVGGVHYETRTETLKRVPCTVLAVLAEGVWEPCLDKEGRVFIDRNGRLFHHILEYLRNYGDARWNLVCDPDDVAPLALEAAYFGLDDLVQSLEE